MAVISRSTALRLNCPSGSTVFGRRGRKPTSKRWSRLWSRRRSPMAEIDELRAERDALKVHNKALTDHAQQLIAELAAKSGTPAWFDAGPDLQCDVTRGVRKARTGSAYGARQIRREAE